MKCNICPRQCNKDREALEKGFCGLSYELKLARAALHYWEEPCISGGVGSGAVFFSGCNLRCIFCQNQNISDGGRGMVVSDERLADIFLNLQDQNAANINLVTPTHFISGIIKAIDKARNNGLNIPIVYNTSGYESVDSLKRLEGYVDVYLPDFKYMDEQLAATFSKAPDYPSVVISAINEMKRQRPVNIFNDGGLINKGVIIRHLVLPGHIKNSLRVLDSIIEHYGAETYVSIMNQYTPLGNPELPSELRRKVTKREYEKVLNHAFDIGIINGYFQDGDTMKESFIPDFDFTGL